MATTRKRNESPGATDWSTAEKDQPVPKEREYPLPLQSLGQPAIKRSLLKSSGRGYDFSKSFEQTRRVRFNFGLDASRSLEVEATLAKLFESLTMECR